MSKGKVVMQNRKKYILSIVICLVVLTCLVVAFNMIGAKNFVPSNKNRILQSILNKKKITSIYNTKDSKEKFLKTHIKVQENVSMWILSNITTDPKCFEEKVVEANAFLSKKEYSKFNLEENEVDYWLGDFNIDKTGKLTFKFANKKLEPKWVNDADTKDIIK